ncbi:MAG: VTT domain-containing protein [candidate division WOR-3 bacterium]
MNAEPGTGPASHRIGTAATIVALIALALLLLVAGRSLWHYFRHPAELRSLVQNWGVWAPFGIVLFQTLQVVIAPLPGNVMSFVAGYALGLWPTIVWLMIGVLLGASVDFLLARLLGRRLIRYLVPAERLAYLDSVILRRGTFYVFLLLLVPNPLGDWIYYLAGLTALPLPVFLLLVLAARLPSNLLECALGSGATRFAWQHWVILAVTGGLLALLYFRNQRRVETWLERLATSKRPIPRSSD